MLKIIFEFNGCTNDKFLFVEYKAKQKIWEGRFGFHNLPLFATTYYVTQLKHHLFELWPLLPLLI